MHALAQPSAGAPGGPGGHAFSRPLALLAVLPLASSALVNLAQHVRAGPTSGMGAMTIVLAGTVGYAVLLDASWPRRLLAAAWPVPALCAWALLRSIVDPPDFEGAQNLLVYLLFGGSLLLAGTLVARHPARMYRWLENGMRWLQAGTLALVLVQFAAFGMPNDGLWWTGSRSTMLVGLIGMHWNLARWLAGRRGSLALALLWLAAIVATTSRTAAAIGLLSLAAASLVQGRRSPWRAGLGIAGVTAAVAAVAALLARSETFHRRVFGGDASLFVGDVAINANGRLNLWQAMWESAMQHPWAGHGLGSSQALIGSSFYFTDELVHPHNDYLRTWHDLGAVGLVLLLAAGAGWLLRLCRVLWRTRRRPRDGAFVLRFTAALTLVEMAVSMLTDNTLVYPFFMGAAGTVVGAGLGLEARRRTARGGAP